MRLLSRYNRVNIPATVIVLLVSGLCYYFIIRSVLLNQLDNDLKVEEQEINDYIKLNGHLPDPSDNKDQSVSFQQTDKALVNRSFRSIRLFYKDDNEWISSRQMLFPVAAEGKTYTVSISKSEEETENLIQFILLITLGIVLILLLLLFVINRFLLNNLWQPFNNTLGRLKQFNLSGNPQLNLEYTPIREFADLNDAVTIMGNRVNKDYLRLKNFTENAAHEMQTPLAIINSKLDVMIQDETLNEYQLKHLQEIYNALDRLSNLNQSLLLLTRIENNQFTEKLPIRLDDQVHEKLLLFEEMIESGKLQISLSLFPVTILSNKQLVDILLNNLLNNAIRYNVPNGSINITLAVNSLVIANTSFLPELDDQKVFQRFYRHADSRQEGNGLGLSIVKQICEMAGYSISYRYLNGVHAFEVHFSGTAH